MIYVFDKKMMFALLCGLMLPSLAHADTTQADATQAKIEKTEKEDQQQLLQNIEKALNDIQTMTADFIQRGPDGAVSQGILYLQRPGKLRFEYGDDIPFLVVSNGTMLSFIDYEVNQVTRWPIGKTPLGVLVSKEISLEGKVDVDDIARFAGLIKIPVIDPDKKDQGYIILTFEESRMELMSWDVIDAQGYQTRVALLNQKYNLDIDKNRFNFKDPRPSKRGPRRR